MVPIIHPKPGDGFPLLLSNHVTSFIRTVCEVLRMSGNSPVEKQKSGRSATSCLECQRRKQKVYGFGDIHTHPIDCC